MGSALGSIVFQVTIAIWPEKLHKLAWLVPWAWGLWAVIWLTWLVTHPTFISSLWARQEPLPTAQPAAPLSNTGNVKVGDLRSGDIRTGDIHINIPPILRPELLPRQQQTEEAKTNIEFLRAKDVNLRFDSYQGLSFHETDEERNLPGLVACFRNDGIYGSKIRTARYLRAHLRFMDADGQEIGTGISGACWLGHKGDLMTLKTDESAYVLIVIRSKEQFYVPWKQRKLVALGSESIFDRDCEFAALPNSVEIRLVDGDDMHVIEPIRLRIFFENGVFRAVLKQQ